jgi:serpin B
VKDISGIAEVTNGIDIDEINRRVDEVTHHMIPKVLEESDVSDYGIVFGNVVYFEAKFEKPFDPKLTQDAKFHGIEGDSDVKMMNVNHECFDYMRDGKVQVLEMPYKNHAFSLGIILPYEVTSSPMISSPSEIESLRSSFQSVEMDRLSIPKFTKRVREDISERLRCAGLSSIFEPSVDFSEMTDYATQIDKVIHEVVIEVDEEGTKASAATFGISKGLSHNFVADRPFTYYVRGPKGMILFVGVFDGSK